MTIHATDATFTNDIATGKPTLVDFWTDWCGPCKRLSPVLDEIASEHPEYAIIKVNAEENPEAAKRFNVSAVPHLAILDAAGNVLIEGPGAKPKATLLKALEAAAKRS